MFNLGLIIGGQTVQKQRAICGQNNRFYTKTFDLIKSATSPQFLYNYFTQLSHCRFSIFSSVSQSFYTLYTGPTITTINI